MNAIYLTLIILGCTAQNITKKAYAQKTTGGVFFFNALTSLSAMLFFAVTSGKLEWDMGVLPYSIAFAVFHSVVMIFSVLAITCGSLSLTTLITSYSLMLPALYGLIFLHDPVSFGLVPGFILLMLSLVLINQKGDGSPVTLKWIIFVTLAFIANGMCSVVQKMQQIAFDGAYKSEFMIIALATSTIAMSIFAVLKERGDIRTYVKYGWLPGILCGLFNGLSNLFVMILSGRMSLSLMFPLISDGGIITTYIISRFFYRERLSKRQLAGFLLGVVSVVFLNI